MQHFSPIGRNGSGTDLDAEAGWDVFLATKIYIPHAQCDIISRTRLSQRLNELIYSPLVIVAAPTGYGKTVLLSEWARSQPHLPAWLSLDASDNEPEQFWQYVVRTLDYAYPGVGTAGLKMFALMQSPRIESLLATVVQAVEAQEHHLVLVLDDYHVIKTPAIHQHMLYLLEHLPSKLHVVLLTREQPPFPLARLRVAQRVVEINAAELRFTADEVERFFAGSSISDLAPEEIATLIECSEGWGAGLQLAALSLRQSTPEQRTALLHAFAHGCSQSLIDYFCEEVFLRLAPDMQQFLLHTALLDRLSVSLCNAVTDAQDSQRFLDALERAQLFLVSLDPERRWYRYHHLFAEFLRRQLRATFPEHVATLHRRAALWYQQDGHLLLALLHAQEAQDMALLCDLIDHVAELSIQKGDIAAALQWLQSLPLQKPCVYLHLWLFRPCSRPVF